MKNTILIVFYCVVFLAVLYRDGLFGAPAVVFLASECVWGTRF